MKNILLEEIERYKRLSTYNPKMTLTENVELISELTVGSTMRELETTLGKNIGTILKDFKIVGMDAAKVTSLLSKDAKSFEKEMLKAFAQDIKNGFPKGELGPLGKQMSKIDLFRNLTNEVKSTGKSLTVQEIETLAKEVNAANKLKAAKFTPKIPKIKPNPDELRVADDLVRQTPQLKKMNWKSLLKWGAGAGVAVGALYAIYKMTHQDEPPVVIDDIPQPAPQPAPQPRTSQYSACTEVYPIKFRCKNETIKKVQACLGLPMKYQTGNFGPITKQALINKGYDGNSITTEITINVCGQNNPNKPPVTTPPVKPEEIEAPDNTINPENF
jgi:hypothetical protein